MTTDRLSPVPEYSKDTIMSQTQSRTDLPETLLTPMGGKLASSLMCSPTPEGRIEKNSAQTAPISTESAPKMLDLGWLEASDERQVGASQAKFACSGLVRAVQQVKLANTLTGVLKAAFSHSRSNVSACDDRGSSLSGREVTGLYFGAGPIGEGVEKAGMGSVWAAQLLKTAVRDEIPSPALVTYEGLGLNKAAIQIPTGWQPRPMIDVQKMILKPAQGLSTPLGSSIKAHDSAQAEAAAKAKPGDQAGSGTSVGPGNSPNIHPITSYSGLGPAGTVNGNAAFGTANSSMKSAGLPSPYSRPWSGTALANALGAGLDMSVPADKGRAMDAFGRAMDSHQRIKARRQQSGPDPVWGKPPAIPGAGQFAPGTGGSNGLLQPQPPAGPPGTDIPPMMPSPSPLIKPKMKLPTDTGPVPPNPGRGLPGTNVIESPLAGSVLDGRLKVADLLPGGRGDGKPDSAFASSSLLRGIKHETEHTKRRPIAKEIAKDHLSEDPAYYRKLEQVEDPKLVDMPKLPAAGKLPHGSDVKATKRTFAEAGQQWYRDVEAVRELAATGHARRTMTQEKFLEWLARPEGQLKAAVSDEALGMKADSGLLGGGAPKLNAPAAPVKAPPLAAPAKALPQADGTNIAPKMGGPFNITRAIKPEPPPPEWRMDKPFPPASSNLSPLHLAPQGQSRTGLLMPSYVHHIPGVAKMQEPLTDDIFTRQATSNLHSIHPRIGALRELTRAGYQPNGIPEKVLYEQSLRGGAQPPLTSHGIGGSNYAKTIALAPGDVPFMDPVRRPDVGIAINHERVNLVNSPVPGRLAETTPDQASVQFGKVPHLVARHEAEHGLQKGLGVPSSDGELGPSLGDLVHLITADKMTRGQNLPLTLSQSSTESPRPPAADERLNLHQFARQAQADGWPRVSMSELISRPTWAGKRRAVAGYGGSVFRQSGQTLVEQRGQDPNLKMPQPLLKSSSVKELWNHPARPFVTQAAVGAGTSLALNEIMRRAIEAYQGKATDPDTVHRERLMAAGMGAGMGLSRAATPHLQAAAKPYLQSLLG